MKHQEILRIAAKELMERADELDSIEEECKYMADLEKKRISELRPEPFKYETSIETIPGGNRITIKRKDRNE